ncbi:hypothetical protein ABPG75_001494 [Micractinium tetrahymenae]
MLFFYLVALPVVACATLWALLFLPSRTTGWLLRLDVGLAWFAALAALVLVPADVAAALARQPPGPLAACWKAAYWYGFLAQVLVLPLHMEFTRSGEFTVRDRLLAAARTNLLYYAVLLGVGLAGLVLLLFSGRLHMEFTRSGEFTVRDRLLAAARTNLLYYAVLLGVGLAGLVLLLFSGRLQPANVLGFCIAFSNAYGLVAAIFLLGFGLVAVPRQLWNSADPRGQQRRVCHSAGLQAERALAAHRRLSAAVLTARRASVLFSPHDPLRPLMDVVLQLADSAGVLCRPDGGSAACLAADRQSVLEWRALVVPAGPAFVPDPGVSILDESDLDIFDRADLARLRRELKAALMDWEREQALYAEAVQEHLRLQAAVASLERRLPEDAPLADQAVWLWRCHLQFWTFRVLAALAALCSLAIVLAEATIAGVLPNLSVVSRALHATSGSVFATELLCFAFLAYPCACAYLAIYRLGRFAFYRMVPRHTDAYSLCYSGLLMCRFAAPLAFNFMAAVAMPEVKSSDLPDVTKTVFYQQFGQLMMRQPLIGWQFTTFAPALLVPYMLLLASGVFRHAVGLFKRGEQLEFEDDWALDSHAAAGNRLLQIESENARNGLPPGLTIQPGGPGASQSAHQASASVSSDRLLSTLRGAAAAAAAEQAAEAAAQRRGAGWLGRLLPGGWGGRQEMTPQRRSVEAQAARGRLTRLLVPGGGGGDLGSSATAAGYTALPTGPPKAAAAAPAAGLVGTSSRPLRVAPGRHERTGSDGPGGDALSSSLGSPSPSGGRGGGVLKAFRARMLAGAGTGAGGGADAAGAVAGGASSLGPGGGSQQAGGE